MTAKQIKSKLSTRHAAEGFALGAEVAAEWLVVEKRCFHDERCFRFNLKINNYTI